jgi:hypothetical protein
LFGSISNHTVGTDADSLNIRRYAVHKAHHSLIITYINMAATKEAA